ncbi:MAG: UDP-N-acetylglucosamine 2-epimerase (non-hydrolyzing) [Planktotalea sp.]|uniref:non-hydrolyzing UDP-N-acetylglucosamine 2-epimerase n=1 Tax=Planktotalea sp. TaxID=2029877 RepID=UPI003C735B2D
MKIVTVVGARPQFVKAAVLRRRCDDFAVQEILVHTGQHYDHAMSDVFFGELGMRAADYKLDLVNRSHAGMTGEIMAGVERILLMEKPDWCVVYGDTNSTLAAALAAAKLHIPVCHIEAGLRSFNKKMPEEINRTLTDHVSDLLFCSTLGSVEQLAAENITRGVHHVGDIMYDAVKMFSKTQSKPEFCAEHGLDPDKPIATVTLHRAETVGVTERFARVLEAMRDVGQGYQLAFPIHPNTLKKSAEFGLSLDGFALLDPMPYLAMQSLLAHSDLVITDSGGIQKEAYFHGTRCVTMRDETEWVETIENGWNRLWTQADYLCVPKAIDDYGNGHSAEEILKIMLDMTPPSQHP